MIYLLYLLLFGFLVTAAIGLLFEQNDLVLDIDEVFQLGQQIE